MTVWLFFSLVTPFLWALDNVLDRARLNHLVKNEYANTMLSVFTRLPLGLGAWWMSGWYMPESREMWLAILAGFLNIIPILFYFKGLEKTDTSQAMLVFDAANPIFVLVLAMIFLGDRLTGWEGLGFVLLFAAGILSNYHLSRKWIFQKALLWMVLSAFFWAHSDIIYDHLVGKFPSLYAIMAWIYFGGFLGGLTLYLSPRVRQRCRLQDFRWSKHAYILFVIVTLSFFLSNFTFLKALSLGTVALTTILTNVQPLFVFLLEWGMAPWYSIVEKPDTRLANLIPKGAALALILAGVWMLTRS